MIEAYKFKDAEALTDEIQKFLELSCVGVGDELLLTVAPNTGGDLKVIVLDLDNTLAFRYQDQEGALPWVIGTPQDVAKEAMSWMGK